MRIWGSVILAGGLLVGCTDGGGSGDVSVSLDTPPPVSVSRRAAAAAGALGVSTGDLYRSPTGCYSYKVRQDGGFFSPLIDSRGNQVCDR